MSYPGRSFRVAERVTVREPTQSPARVSILIVKKQMLVYLDLILEGKRSQLVCLLIMSVQSTHTTLTPALK